MNKLILTFTLITAIFATSNESYALNVKAKAYILKDLSTGKVLASKNENLYLPPASTTKLMTLYILFEKIKSGEISLKQRLTVSKKAWRKGGSKMFLDPGSKIRVVDLIKGIAVSSGNDASTVIAEYISGSEKEFVALMNKKAKSFKMTKTNFVNATGWDNKGHVSTANDLAILGERIIKDFPEYYKVFSLKSFKHNNIRQYNKNTLLGKHGIDGLKTGHVGSIGYNIVSSAKQNEARYLVVILGANSKKARATEAAKLYKYAYEKYKSVKLLTAGQVINQTQVFLGTNKFIDVIVKDDLFMSLTKSEFETLSASYTYYPIKNAPVYYGDKLGYISIKYDGGKAKNIDLIAANPSSKLEFTDLIKEKLNYKFNKDTYFK